MRLTLPHSEGRKLRGGGDRRFPTLLGHPLSFCRMTVADRIGHRTPICARMRILPCWQETRSPTSGPLCVSPARCTLLQKRIAPFLLILSSKRSTNLSRSTTRAARRDTPSLARWIGRFLYAAARGLTKLARCASANPGVLPTGTTSSTSPIRRAVAASTRSLQRIICFAQPSPTSQGSVWVPTSRRKKTY